MKQFSWSLSAFCLAGLGLAAVLAAVGLAWPLWFQPQDLWSVEQAREYQDAFEAVHAATHGEAGEHPPDEAFFEAEARYRKISGELEAARTLRTRWSRFFLNTGLVLAIVSGLGYLAVRQA